MVNSSHGASEQNQFTILKHIHIEVLCTVVTTSEVIGVTCDTHLYPCGWDFQCILNGVEAFFQIEISTDSVDGIQLSWTHSYSKKHDSSKSGDEKIRKKFLQLLCTWKRRNMKKRYLFLMSKSDIFVSDLCGLSHGRFAQNQISGIAQNRILYNIVKFHCSNLLFVVATFL